MNDFRNGDGWQTLGIVAVGIILLVCILIPPKPTPVPKFTLIHAGTIYTPELFSSGEAYISFKDSEGNLILLPKANTYIKLRKDSFDEQEECELQTQESY